MPKNRLPFTIYQFHFFALLTLATVLDLAAAHAAEDQLAKQDLVASRGRREVIWDFDVALRSYFFTLPDHSKVQGYGGSFAAGYGRTRGDQWLIGHFHFISGPWERARNRSFDADFAGSAIDIEYGSAFPGFSLRSEPSPTLSLAIGYLDMKGKSVGGNHFHNGNPNDISNYNLEQSFQTGVSALTLTPTLGLSWTEPARPTGNEPEFLTTRIESSFVRLGAQIPLYSRARVEVTKRTSANDPTEQTRKHTTTGVVRGFSLILATGVWLGI